MRSKKQKLPPLKRTTLPPVPPRKRTVTEETRRILEGWDRVAARTSEPVRAVCRCGVTYVIDPLNMLHCPKPASTPPAPAADKMD